MKNKDFLKYRDMQGDLGYIYNSAQERMKWHTEYAEKCKNVIKEYPYYETEKEALNAAMKMDKESDLCTIIFAKIEKDEEFYYLDKPFIVTNDGNVKIAAEYIGMAHIPYKQ